MKWFKHDSDANMDDKLQEILLDYGLEGYGLYWYCIELITGKVSADSVTFELKHDARVIARNTGSTPQKVQEMMSKFIELGLFENIEGTITCLKLAKRLDKSMTSNSDMRKIIGNISKSHDPIMTASGKVMQDKKRLEEIRGDEIIKKPSPTKVEDEAPSYKTKKGRTLKGEQLEWFEEFWASFNYKKSKAEAADSWHEAKVTAGLAEAIFLAARVEAVNRQTLLNQGRTPKMAQGWLSGKRWEDEQAPAVQMQRPMSRIEQVRANLENPALSVINQNGVIGND